MLWPPVEHRSATSICDVFSNAWLRPCPYNHDYCWFYFDWQESFFLCLINKTCWFLYFEQPEKLVLLKNSIKRKENSTQIENQHLCLCHPNFCWFYCDWQESLILGFWTIRKVDLQESLIMGFWTTRNVDSTQIQNQHSGRHMTFRKCTMHMPILLFLCW